MTRLLLALIALLALAVHARDLDGLPPDLTGLVGFTAVALALAAVAFAIGRWSRG